MYSIISWIIISYVLIMYVSRVENNRIIENWWIISMKEISIEYSLVLILLYVSIIVIYKYISKEVLDILLLSNWLFLIGVSSMNMIFLYIVIYMVNILLILV